MSARRWRRTLRSLAELRSPAVTAFRWLQVDDDGVALLGGPDRALGCQPADRVVVGEDVRVDDHVRVFLGPHGRLEVGDGVAIARHVLLAVDRWVRLEAGCRLGPYAVVTDTWAYGRPAPPGVFVPDPVPVVVGTAARVGARATLGPGTRVPAGGHVPVGHVWHEEVA